MAVPTASVSTKSYVYLIRCHDHYKLGIAYRLNPRLSVLQCGNPYKLDLVAAVLSEDARGLERELHQQYADNNTLREWFELTDNDIKDITNMMQKLGGTIYATI